MSSLEIFGTGRWSVSALWDSPRRSCWRPSRVAVVWKAAGTAAGGQCRSDLDRYLAGGPYEPLWVREADNAVS